MEYMDKLVKELGGNPDRVVYKRKDDLFNSDQEGKIDYIRIIIIEIMIFSDDDFYGIDFNYTC